MNDDYSKIIRQAAFEKTKNLMWQMIDMENAHQNNITGGVLRCITGNSYEDLVREGKDLKIGMRYFK